MEVNLNGGGPGKEAGRSRGMGMGWSRGGCWVGSEVREARRMRGGPGTGAKMVPVVGRRSRGAGRGVARRYRERASGKNSRRVRCGLWV